MMSSASSYFVIVFILRILKFKPDIIAHLFKKYGKHEVKYYRKLLDSNRKLEKSKLNLEYLMKCKTYNTMPKFLRFKLYRKSLHDTSLYKSWQHKLLDQEIYK